MNSKIPKRIIQTGKSLDLPLHAKAAVSNIRLLNPDFEYRFFDDEQVEKFLDAHFPEYRGVFHSFRYPIQRVDFFRYLAIYQFGGFYFDLDVFLARGLSDLLDFRCIFPFEELTINGYLRKMYGMDWEIGNYAFGAVAGHPFIKEVIKNCVKAQRDSEWVKPMLLSYPKIFRERYLVLCTTGPGLVSRTLAEYSDAASQVKILFPEDVRDRSKWHKFGTYGIHLMENTWKNRKIPMINRLRAIWERQKSKEASRVADKYGTTRELEFRRNA